MRNKTLMIIFLLFYVSCICCQNTKAISPTPYCGPVACYVALKHFGVDCTLEQVSTSCGYNDKPVKLIDIRNTLKSFGDVECSVAKCNSRKIKEYLSFPNTVLLLVLQSEDDEQADHLVVLLSKEDRYVWIDYPKIMANYNLEELPERLFEKCLVVREKAKKIHFNSIGLCTSFAIVVALFFLFGKKLKKAQGNVILIFGIFLVSAYCYGSSICNSKQKIAIDYDLGLIESTEPNVIKEVSIKNELMAPLSIEEVMVSCSSCIKPLSYPDKIEPQKTSLLKFEIITEGRKGAISPRSVINGDIASYIINFKGYIRSLWPENKAIELGNVRSGETVHRKLKLLQAGYPNAKIVKIECPDNSSTHRSKENKFGNTKNEVGCFELLDLAFDFSDVKLGSFDEKIKIKTNIEKYSEIIVPVKAYVIGNITLYPSKIIFINSKSDNTVRNIKAILNQSNERQYDPKEFKFISDNPNLKTTLLDYNDEKKVMNIEIILSQNSQLPKSLNGEIVVYYQEKEIFKIPYIIISTQSNL